MLIRRLPKVTRKSPELAQEIPRNQNALADCIDSKQSKLQLQTKWTNQIGPKMLEYSSSAVKGYFG